MIEAVDQFVLPFIDSLYGRFGYIGVVIAMAIESAAIPIPSELILPFAGWSVSRGIVEPLTGGPWTYWGARPLRPSPEASFDTGLDLFAMRKMRMLPTLRVLGQMASPDPGGPHGRPYTLGLP